MVPLNDKIANHKSAKKLINSQDMLMSAELTSHTQYITCYVMCDEIGSSILLSWSECASFAYRRQLGLCGTPN